METEKPEMTRRARENGWPDRKLLSSPLRHFYASQGGFCIAKKGENQTENVNKFITKSERGEWLHSEILQSLTKQRFCLNC